MGIVFSQDPFDAAKLPPNRNQAWVFCSDGPTGWKSLQAMLVPCVTARDLLSKTEQAVFQRGTGCGAP